ncbi:hypothetical protein HanRHA438_Chr08g0357201 [Helianthus annuus]|nr:hypothetical protein HanRHA438_MTg0865941 [Helianthus annuus]KAJ0898474.1 hypothetical protein HanRHA438_Chr08g0357201 [Helianthus annuus]
MEGGQGADRCRLGSCSSLQEVRQRSRRELRLDGRGIPMAARKATVKVAAIGSHKFGRFGERGTNATSLGYGSEYCLA